MNIRRAKSDDIGELVEMSRRMHEESAYSFLPFDPEKVRRLMAQVVADPEGWCGLVAEEGGRAVGMFGGYMAEYFFCDERLACDMVLFVEPERRGSSAAARLVRAFRDWAAERGAREICLAVTAGVNAERVGLFYERFGLARVGGVYKQRLS